MERREGENVRGKSLCVGPGTEEILVHVESCSFIRGKKLPK